MTELYASESTPKQSESKDVGLWHERIDIAKKAQEQWAKESRVDKFIKEYKGKFELRFGTSRGDIDVPPINEVFAYVQSDLATTYNRDPYIAVNPKAGSPRGAAFWEVILNYYWRELKTKDEIEFAIIDKDLVGYAWHKVGYNPDIGSIYSNWINWKDVFWNVGSKRAPNDCQWMAHRIIKPLNEMKKRYPAAKGLSGVPDPEVDDDTYKKSTYKDDIKIGVIYEIWDKQDRQVKVIAEGLEDRYLDAPKPWPAYLDEFPLLMYWDFAVPGSSRPMSAIAPWEAQILQEMELMGRAVKHANRWSRQVFANAAAFDDTALGKFERGDDGAIITVNGKVGPEDLRFADYGQLPTDFYLLMDRLQAIKRNVNGQPEFVRGGVTKTGTRTIGELNLIQQGTKGRQDRKIDRLETFCENIARHMIANLKGNFDFEQTVKITGDTPENVIQALGANFDPVTRSVTFTPEDIEGEYDVDIKAGSTLPLDKQTRLQMMEIVLNTVAQAVPNGPMSPFLNTLIQELLKDYEIKSLQESYQLEVQQAEEAKQAQQGQQSVQDQKTQAETAKRQAQAQQIGVDTEIATQEAQLGPVARAQLERLKKPEPRPVAGASK